ncbi:MAG: hypothetical protein HZB46_05310 [Solirubrobacterales bacterium]|nr:hypothetical protein [Solirubrobacterales bacterium]
MTPAQVIGLLSAGVPVLANLLLVFGVYDLNAAQQDALNQAVQWGGLVAIGLFGADFGLRAARNGADAKVRSTMLAATAEPPVIPVGAIPVAVEPSAAPVEPPAPPVAMEMPPVVPSGGAGYDEDEMAYGDEDLPSDEEEFANGPDGPMWASGDEDTGPDSRLRPVAVEDAP